MAKLSVTDEQLFDRILQNALNMLRVSAQERAAIFEKLQAMQDEVLDKLADFNTQTDDQNRTERFINKIWEEIDDTYADISEQVDLPGLAKYVGDDMKDSLEVVLGKDANSLPKTYIKSVESDVLIQGSPAAHWWKGQSVDLQNKFARQLRMGMSAGETNQQIVQRIIGKDGVGGIMQTTRANAAALVQTTVQTVANHARRQTFLENNDLVKGLRQVSTLDSHTTIICVSYSGAEWDLDFQPINGNTLPFNNGTPRHWNCRSVEVPITVTFRDLGIDIDEPTSTTRASSDGQVPGNTTFDAFLKRMGEDYQNEVLGPGRAQLWREGKITLRDLVDGSGNPISLAELRDRGAAFGAKPLEFFSPEYMAGLPKKVNQPVNTWEALTNKGTEGKRQFDAAMGKVAKELGLRTDIKPDDLTGDLLTNKDGFLFTAPLKSKERADEKLTGDDLFIKGTDKLDYSQLRDVVRGTISVPTLSEAKAAIAEMQRQGIDFAMQPKDRFNNPLSSGYRDILGIVRMPNGTLGEMQFHVKEMTAAKNSGHALYEIARSLEAKYAGADKSIWSEADTIAYEAANNAQRQIYDAAWRDILKAETNGD